jgi:hypothetical protein
MTDSTEQEKARQRGIRATVLVLTLVALAFFFTAFFKVWK